MAANLCEEVMSILFCSRYRYKYVERGTREVGMRDEVQSKWFEYKLIISVRFYLLK